MSVQPDAADGGGACHGPADRGSRGLPPCGPDLVGSCGRELANRLSPGRVERVRGQRDPVPSGDELGPGTCPSSWAGPTPPRTPAAPASSGQLIQEVQQSRVSALGVLDQQHHRAYRGPVRPKTAATRRTDPPAATSPIVSADADAEQPGSRAGVPTGRRTELIDMRHLQ